ncbi:LuxR C-terminal-related transcriptional regulator [Acaryochloris sp. IP29b_bin.137]|uniref:response regulator transcription factor n=1 Tax=Acaryochloris sp. IP29b_bin.137 TaxID=2969217 RepID=UPI002628BECC|nr:LuxR C-terminal-related transcriptional regulator [Acaryochloris sp. IP29b_bin.137]
MVDQFMLGESPYFLDRLRSSCIISEFKIENRLYLVVVCEILKEPNFSNTSYSNSKTELNFLDYTEICQFEINGQSCAIIEIKTTESTANIPKLLTERELQIAHLVAQGQQNKQIAKQLRISEWTVSTHLRRIFAKLNVDSRAAMVFRCADLLKSLQTLQALSNSKLN